MQSKQLYSEVGYYIREKIDKRVSLKEFFDQSCFAVPSNLEEGKSRIILNCSTMGGNYFIIFASLLCLFLVLHPILILPIGVSLGLLYIVTDNENEKISILGHSFHKFHLYLMAFGLPIIFFIIMPSSLVSLFFTTTLSLLLCIGHMVIYKPKIREEEEHI